MVTLTVGQIDALRPKINERRKIEQGTWCILWTGTTLGKDTQYPYFYYRTKQSKLNINVRRFVWQDRYGPIPTRHQLWSTCHNNLCTNPDHLELQTPLENPLSKQPRPHPDDYKQQPCHKCARMCRFRGAFIKGVFKAFRQSDGSVLCGICESMRTRTANKVVKTTKVRYDGSVDDLLEDLEWLLDFGETLEVTAQRLKFSSAKELETLLVQIDREDLITRFKRIGVVNDV